MAETSECVGETFESKDYRESGRRIRVVRLVGKTRDGLPRYECVNVQHMDPQQVGKMTLLSLPTLRRYWRQAGPR